MHSTDSDTGSLIMFPRSQKRRFGERSCRPIAGVRCLRVGKDDREDRYA